MSLQHRTQLIQALARVETHAPATAMIAFVDLLGEEIDAVEVATEIEVVAAAHLPAFTMVTATGERADSGNPAHYGKVVGITQVEVLSGFIATLVTDTEVTNPSWSWSPGDVLFLNGTSISTTPPASGFIQIIGVARTATTIIVQLQPPILL